MKQALILVGVVALMGVLAAGAQNEGQYVGPGHMGWLLGTPQEAPTTAPTGEFATDPTLGAQPAAAG